jgi:hypothetical protein
VTTTVTPFGLARASGESEAKKKATPIAATRIARETATRVPGSFPSVGGLLVVERRHVAHLGDVSA